MLQILTLYVHALKVKQYFAFMLFVSEAIKKFEVIGQKFAFNVEKFTAAFNNLNHVYLKYDPVFYSDKLNKANEERISAFRLFRNYLRTFILNPESEAKIAMAERLLKVIDLYGGSAIVSERMSSLTTILTNIVEDFEEKFAADIAALEASQRLANLKKAQQEFDKVYMERTEYDSEIGLNAMAEARKLMSEVYRNLINAINFNAKYDTDGLFTDFIKYLNVEIRKNFSDTGQSGSSSSEGDGSDVIPMRFATFKFNDDTSLKLKVEVGAPLVAPKNTEGYMWKPIVPAIMPAKNITFREVLIPEEETTAVFHFIDHTETEIKQPIGTPLTAPANTAGCVWQPKVPVEMPDQDTSYYEVMIGEGGGGSTNPPSGGNGGSSDNNGSDNGGSNPPTGGDSGSTNPPTGGGGGAVRPEPDEDDGL